jgi:hypothetical protein
MEVLRAHARVDGAARGVVHSRSYYLSFFSRIATSNFASVCHAHRSFAMALTAATMSIRV